jgi:hypothetical protein
VHRHESAIGRSPEKVDFGLFERRAGRCESDAAIDPHRPDPILDGLQMIKVVLR